MSIKYNLKISVNIFILLLMLFVLCGVLFVLFYQRKSYDVIIPVYRKLTYSVPDVEDISHISNNISTAAISVRSLIFEGLVEIGQRLEIKPALATSWRISDDGKVYVFVLAKNVEFHDGTMLDSKYVLNFFTRLSKIDSPIKHIFSKVKSLYINNNDELVFELTEKYPSFISILSSPFAKISKIDFKTGVPIGTGCFRFKEIINKKILVLERFYNNKRKSAKIERIEFWSLDERTGFEKANVGFLHDTILIPMLPGKIKKDSKLVERQWPAAATWLISFNTSNVFLKDEKLRNCLSKNFDRNGFIRNYIPHHQKALGFLPLTLFGNPNLILPIIDNSECELFKKDEIILTLDYPIVLERGREMCEFIGSHWLKSMNINLKCNGVDYELLLERIKSKAFELSFFSQTLDLPDPEYFLDAFESTSVLNFSNLHSKLFDSLLDRARKTLDRMERWKLYKELDQYLLSQSITINISYPQNVSYVHKCIKNFEVGLAGESFVDYTSIDIDPDCSFMKDFNY